MARDDFKSRVKQELAKRAAYICSNPDCRSTTIGASGNDKDSINIGVACHILAASPGGPRFDVNMTREERSDIKNGIWLCQNCSKLIDVDTFSYNFDTLKFWKETRESETRLGIGKIMSQEYYPQPAGADYTPIPKIRDVRYEIARAKLIDSGWIPLMHSWSYPSEEFTLQGGNGEYYWGQGFWEIDVACPTGFAYCKFSFSDVKRNRLIVITIGECSPEDNIYPRVSAFYITNEDED